MDAEKMSAGKVLTSPHDCIHKFGIDPYRCDRCKWDFRNGEPPMFPEDAIKAIDWMLDTRTFDSKEAEGIRAAVAAMAEREAALIAENKALRPVVNPGEVLVEVHGLTGSGKSAVAGEIEILCKALGLDVRWENGDEEKFLTHADWTAALELYTPRVRIVEINTPRPAAIDAARAEAGHG